MKQTSLALALHALVKSRGIGAQALPPWQMLALLRAQQLNLAVGTAEALREVLHGVEIPDVELSNRDSDGMLRVLGDTELEGMIARLDLTLSEPDLLDVDLPFRDLTTWVAYCRGKGVTGPGSSPAQRDLIGELIDHLLDQLRAVRQQRFCWVAS